MTEGAPTKVIAASMGLAAFALAIIAGLAAGNDADHILGTALVALAACAAVGWALGAAAERAVLDAVSTYEQNHPIPSADPRAGAPAQAAPESLQST